MNEQQYREKWHGKGWTRERVEDALAVFMPGWTIRNPKWMPKNANDKAPLKCPNGHEVDRRLCNLYQGLGCKECKLEAERREMAERFIAALEKGGYTPLFTVKDYLNAHQKLPALCPAGNPYQTTYNHFVDKGARCACSACDRRKGNKRKRRTPEQIISELRAVGEEALETPKNASTKILSRCMKCGYERQIVPKDYIYGRTSCGNCANRRKKSTEEYRENELRPKGWDLPEGVEYAGALKAIPHRCPHGHVTMKRPADWRGGYGCSVCADEKQSEERRGVNPVTGEELTEEEIAELEEARKSPEYRRWRENVLARDNERCVLCGSTHEPQAHHLYSFKNYRELRYEEDNGLVLCAAHHLSRYEGSFHAVHGQDGQTVAPQFLEYLDNYIENNPDADKRRLFNLRQKVELLIERVEGVKIQKEAV
jgi:hypothetical protein